MLHIVYIDGLFYKGAGIGRYYESLLKGLAKKDVKIYTCVPLQLKRDFELDFEQYFENVMPIYVNYKGFSIKAFWSQGKILKKLERKVSLFHFPHINIPLYIPKNLVVTIHDLRPFTKYWDRSYFKKKIYKWYFKRTVKKAEKIISVSETIKKEILLQCFINSSKVRVIHESVDEKFFHSNILEKKNDKNIIGDYILFVGSRKKHKNLSRLILVFNQVKNNFPNLKLVIAGKKDSKIDDIDLLRNKLDLKEKIIEVISPGDEEIINLYKYAKAFIFPSLYEGFGLPPLEAMTIGTPVLASDIPVLKEVCNDGVYFFNPRNIADMARAIRKVLTDNNLRKYLVEKGKERVSFFCPEKAISRHIKIYEETSSEK